MSQGGVSLGKGRAGTMQYSVRYRILRDGRTIQLSSFELKTLAGVQAKYHKIACAIHRTFQFRIETQDESVTWIGWGESA